MWEETWKTLSLCALQGVRCSSVAADSAWVQTPAPALTLFSCRFIFCRMGVKASTLYSCCHDSETRHSVIKCCLVSPCTSRAWPGLGTPSERATALWWQS